MRIFRWQFLGVANFDKVAVFLVSKRFGHGMSHTAEKDGPYEKDGNSVG